MTVSFQVMNGWLGLAHDSTWYFYNVVDKVFAVVSRNRLEQTETSLILPPVDIIPTPDFACETQAAAITLTTKCNISCPYCFVKPVDRVAEMTPQDACHAVNALGRQSASDLVVFAWGGEPTQNPTALTAMLQQARAYPHMKICLVTNGVIESAFLRELLDYDLAFQLPFDGVISHDVQKPMCGTSSLERMLYSLRTISKVSRRVALRATVTRRNTEELGKCLLPTVRRHTNRLMIEHLHTYNGRATAMAAEEPDVDGYVDLVFGLVPTAEAEGVHVKVLPLDQLRAGGPSSKMTFLNILPGGSVVASNAVIDSSQPHFTALHIGDLVGDRIAYAHPQAEVLRQRYLNSYHEHCHGCVARTVCRGSVLRYPFLALDSLEGWSTSRCDYFVAVVVRWMREMVWAVSTFMRKLGLTEGLVELVPPSGRVHYPMFPMSGGLSLSYKPLTSSDQKSDS